ncbi:MAG: hypothetical protein QXR09_01195 [Candidatus Aenigmatarchaeota archaeon]
MSNEDLIVIPIEINFPDFYNKYFSSVPDPKKNVKRGQPYIAYRDEERNSCEISFTYIIKKEMRVIFTLQFEKEDNSYKGRISQTDVALLKVERNSLENKWRGSLEKAKNNQETKDAVESFLHDINKIREELQRQYSPSTKHLF